MAKRSQIKEGKRIPKMKTAGEVSPRKTSNNQEFQKQSITAYKKIYPQVQSFKIEQLVMKKEKRVISISSIQNHTKKVKSSLRKVFSKDGILITDPEKILQEIQKFFSDLYKAVSVTPSENLLKPYLESPERLTPENVQFCEGKLTVAECLRSLQL